MLAKEMISDVVPAVKTSDTGQTALNWMEIFRVSHLPIVNEHDYLGLISDSDIYDLNQPEEANRQSLPFAAKALCDKQQAYLRSARPRCETQAYRRSCTR